MRSRAAGAACDPGRCAVCPGSADCSPEIPGLVDSLDKKASLRQHATGKSATSAEIATSSRARRRTATAWVGVGGC